LTSDKRKVGGPEKLSNRGSTFLSLASETISS